VEREVDEQLHVVQAVEVYQDKNFSDQKEA